MNVAPLEENDSATARESPGSIRIGQTLGDRYRVDAFLGQGGMGDVWRAYDLKVKVDVAIKAVRPERLGKGGLELLRREVRSARAVSSPHVCRIFDLVEVNGREVVSMEYVDGVTLRERLDSESPLTLLSAGEIATQILSGLGAIHDAGLIHRDLKPENIMITRPGRVVIMDFGIARVESRPSHGTIVGTGPYMAPEQIHGDAVDSRVDIYAAGVVLAEMVAPAGVRRAEERERLWGDLCREPPVPPDTPWGQVLKGAVARRAEDRPMSARGFVQALEEITLRVDGAEERRPYPGLSAFTESNSEYFFGREAEVETVWKKLARSHMQALIGPSGVGKSSFLRAGLASTRPEGWSSVRITPGSEPFLSLDLALATELSEDTGVTHDPLGVDGLSAILESLARWRGRHSEVLLIVDQFEELFTLNPPEVQARFAELLGLAAIDLGVRVLVAIRDDFFFRCHEHTALSPLFAELTPLGQLSGDELRRALVRPALSCGYRFEDEELIAEMLEEVAEERGALPLLAFAASRLWELRDRDRCLLTRTAYRQIGEVSGALAQHAERTLETIGTQRLPIVREIFRNLVTAQGTRASRDVEELLSVFSTDERVEGRMAARKALQTMVEARLLTTYESVADSVGDDGRPLQRVEIIHESLLTQWPRLVRWRAQDPEGAQLRAEVRQAAELWEMRDRPDNLHWTGTSFQDLELWRAQYPGGLTASEEAFAAAMVKRAARRRRRKQAGMAAILTTALLLIAITSLLLRRVEVARDEPPLDPSVTAQRRALGRDDLDVLDSVYSQGELYWKQGRYAEAEQSIAETLVARRQSLGNEHPKTLKALSFLALLTHLQGRDEEAEELSIEAFEGRRRALGEEHIDTLKSMNNLAFLYRSQGRFEEADKLSLEFIPRMRRVLGDDHPHTLMAINSRGMLLMTQGRFDEAEPWFAEALVTHRRLFGDADPRTLESLHSLGILYRLQGRLDEAAVHLDEAIDSAVSSLRPGHPRTNVLITELARVRALQGRNTESLDLIRQAVDAGWANLEFFEEMDLESLHGHPTFQSLALEVGEKAG